MNESTKQFYKDCREYGIDVYDTNGDLLNSEEVLKQWDDEK